MSNNASSHRAYYNEIDPYCAQWLRNLIAAGHIAPGDVDERSIVDVRPDDLRGYIQCHFFAGIGVWSYALRRAGWPDERAVWSGSAPCQPFSAAGKRSGFADERHLWPAFHCLISQCRPPVVFGEQVASKDGLAWLDLVQADMEGTGYAIGTADTCAAGVGAPHIRQRLYWVADAMRCRNGSSPRTSDCQESAPIEINGHLSRSGAPFGECGSSGIALGDASGARLSERECDGSIQQDPLGSSERKALISSSNTGELAFSDERQRRQGRIATGTEGRTQSEFAGSGTTRGFWSDAEWIECRDGKARPTKPGIFPLAARTSGRVGKLRAYGNSINAEQAKEFIAAYLDCGG